jgi:hypothetical protein
VRRAALVAALGAALAAAGAGTAAGQPVAVTVQAEPGHIEQAIRALGPRRITRRQGTVLQVVADRTQVPGIRRLPGVAAAYAAPSSFEDGLESEGVARTGAAVLGRVADGGRGVTIAVLDQGFGTHIPLLQSLGELPPAGRLLTQSFDTVNGLAGRNAYGNATNHGELVAQTVYDYAPEAYYLYVNYDSEADFVAATDWLVQRRPDIVVHSNSFLEGPFDGTGPSARAVDRAADAGILWFNSAGNYATKHWTGPWADADGDKVLDWPVPDWTFAAGYGDTISFSLSWTPGTPAKAGDDPTDLDLTLERQDAEGWVAVARSGDHQVDGASPAERILGYSPAPATYRLRANLVAGPPPKDITLFSREIDLPEMGGSPVSSIPTPGDAAGSITVGAIDWRGNRYKRYSSQGPTDDGRLKPDIVAPTDTRVVDRNGGPRRVGGTSNAAPNAAGAAAVMLAAARRAGQPVSATSVREQLTSLALDLGPPGPDEIFGAGRVRLETTPPKLVRPEPAPLAPVRGRARIGFQALDRSPLASWSVRLDDKRVKLVYGRLPRPFRVNTLGLADGFHVLHAEATDLPGNASSFQWTIRIDNTLPSLAYGGIEVLGRQTARVPPKKARGKAAKRRRAALARLARTARPVRVVLAGQDPDASAAMTLRAVVLTSAGQGVRVKRFRVPQGAERRLSLGRLRPARYRLVLELTDRAGNVTRVRRTVLVRPIQGLGPGERPRPLEPAPTVTIPTSPTPPAPPAGPETEGEAPTPAGG